MNTGKAIRVALAQRDMKMNDLAEVLGVTAARVSVICSSKSSSTLTLKRIADALGMKVSELVELGEGN